MIKRQLANELSIQPWQVENTVQLLDEGATIPFIARYRKEKTGSLDDNVLRQFAERLEYLRGLEKRKEEVMATIVEQEKMTDELRLAITRATTLVEVEDIYRPYRPRRRTRGTMAREKGLEPLAQQLLAQDPDVDPLEIAEDYVDLEKEVETAEDALAGAMDIIAEDISDDANIRKHLRGLFLRSSKIVTTAATDEDSVYSQYYEYEEATSSIPGHRILAINRGEKEKFLRVGLEVDEPRSTKMIYDAILTPEDSPARPYLVEAADDSFSRLVFPSLENEVRGILTQRAEEGAMELFSENLRQLLLQPPVKGKVVVGLDPGLRTGCKVAVVDETGKPLATDVIYPVPPNPRRTQQAKETLERLVHSFDADIIAIGNGTASRETELFVADFLSGIDKPVSYIVISEAGASVYSASALAADEFPDYDVTERSAISIARRLQDPLAELVKIDPKSIGVGQYQHDMPQNALDTSLGGVVEDAVNTVGVDLNTASYSLLAYVAGVNATVARNIVNHREENGEFSSRTQLMEIPRLGKKTFEQCAGFLRIPKASYILDNTAVHPESYDAAQSVLSQCGFTLEDVAQGNISTLKNKVKELGTSTIAETAGIGIPTLEDIVEELLRPGRDLRDSLPAPILRTDVLSLSDLKEGMILNGTVRNVIDFGAFVDIGVHQDGLVHISELSQRYVKHPLDVVKVGDIVKVKVISVDEKRNRIGLSMKDVSQEG